jgi:hypothetical protein
VADGEDHDDAHEGLCGALARRVGRGRLTREDRWTCVQWSAVWGVQAGAEPERGGGAGQTELQLDLF